MAPNLGRHDPYTKADPAQYAQWANLLDQYADDVERSDVETRLKDALQRLFSGFLDDEATQAVNDAIIAEGGINDAVVASLVQTITDTSSAIKNLVNLEVGEVVMLRGPGIDPTGVTDSTVGINTLLSNISEGVKVRANPTDTFLVTGTITIPVKSIFEGGTYYWPNGIESLPGIKAMASETTIHNTRLINESIPTATGGRNVGIQFAGDYDLVAINNYVEGFNSGIMAPHGSGAHNPYNIIIANNRVKDIVGVGGGPDSSSSQGEDRGDGIIVWGAQSTVVGNIVNAKVGTDARIGIHAEYTGGSSTTGTPHPRSLVTFAGNVVYGQFRRGIVFENIHAGSMVGNVIADSTWWGINITMASKACVATGNSIIWTRTSEDNQGQSWNPKRAAIGMIGPGEGNIISNTAVVVRDGAYLPFGVMASPSNGAAPTDAVIDGLLISIEGSGSINRGVHFEVGPVRPTIKGLRVRGTMDNGIYLYQVVEPIVVNNIIEGNGQFGVTIEGNNGPAQISENIIVGYTHGINSPSASRRIITLNRIRNTSRGVIAFELDNSIITHNIFDTVLTSVWSAAASSITTPNIHIPPPAWAATTAYTVSSRVLLTTGELMEAIVAGTSDAVEPIPPAIDETVVDGTVTWVRIL